MFIIIKLKKSPLKEMPLTFEVLSPGELFFGHLSNDEFSRTIEYSKNGSEWTSIISSLVTIFEEEESVVVSGGTKIPVLTGDIVQFRGNNTNYANNNGISMFGSYESKCKIKGNIMSLITSTDFANLTTLESNSTFTRLFGLFVNLTDASKLLLPATTLTINCYSGMFNGCTGLTTAPTLPATTLASNCYQSMFAGCTNLTTAPELPATTLAIQCYQDMFDGCISLVNGPSSIGTSATTIDAYACESMFNKCSSLTTAPTLPATILADYCYSNMFASCTSLNNIKCLATDMSASNCTNSWVNGVASTGRFVASSSTNWTTGDNGIPNGWARVNA